MPSPLHAPPSRPRAECELPNRFQPVVAGDLDAIALRILDYAGPDKAARKLNEIEEAIATLNDTPHKGSLRPEIAPRLCAIPAGRKRAGPRQHLHRTPLAIPEV